MFTPKQERNGTDMSAGEMPSTSRATDDAAQIAGLQSRAEAVGAYRFGQQAHNDIWVTPFGTGVSGGEYANPGGSMWQWDAGLAVDEMPGEWSQPGVAPRSV